MAIPALENPLRMAPMTSLPLLRLNISTGTPRLTYTTEVARLTVVSPPVIILLTETLLHPPVLGPIPGLSLQTLLIVPVRRTVLVLTLIV